ncbi:uncharacterized protein F4822DRAFT_401389 [Hypoxylon trugodes]|uniref:uncharacterized protein n=1 Tax=Hypoxylon trugodes TaxID=326681 RepID=UPI00219B2B3F|nr:uncharacterized protein F4822DRAFT_401389 [Hypoxylon trugodes]KAI1390273.1 hypothetical protein F4822DRAFT_401389 [Hypoxylon trugodes]
MDAIKSLYNHFTMPAQQTVSRQQVRDSNARLDAETYPRVAVFVGGTSGIGEATLEELVLAGKGKYAVRIYVVGRAASATRVNANLDRLREMNPLAELIWTEGEISLLSEVRRICDVVRERERSLDLLLVTPGYAPFGGREETTEGLAVPLVLGYYARIMFTQLLLPLLKESTIQGRVLAILGHGTMDFFFDINDLNLEKPGNFGGGKCQCHSSIMLTMGMEQLAEEHKDVTFIHSYPGLVNTGNLNRGWRGHWFLQALANIVLAPAFFFIAMSIEESRERTLYMLTSAKYGGHGVPLGGGVVPGLTERGEETGGIFLVNHKNATKSDEKWMKRMREKAKEKILTTTEKVLGPYV